MFFSLILLQIFLLSVLWLFNSERTVACRQLSAPTLGFARGLFQYPLALSKKKPNGGPFPFSPRSSCHIQTASTEIRLPTKKHTYLLPTYPRDLRTTTISTCGGKRKKTCLSNCYLSKSLYNHKKEVAVKNERARLSISSGLEQITDRVKPMAPPFSGHGERKEFAAGIMSLERYMTLMVKMSRLKGLEGNLRCTTKLHKT
ncbi:hypothetical protein DFH27DRAFT_321571 [Peziza echinospora]|nr:hypothetical protein DFH27DRAFT_321571 [Peziza echinospora]